MEKIENFISKYWYIFLLLLIIPAVWSLTVPGFYGASDDMHPAWIQQLDRALSLGNFPPRMAPDLSFGFGYPLWNFISPLPFYVGELIHRLGFNFVDSVKLSFGLATILAAVGMFYLVRSLSTPLIGLTAAVLYTYTPYRAVDLYIRGAIGEIWAFVFFPIILLSIIKGWGLVGGLGIAGLILSHNIGSYMFLPFAIVLGLILSIKDKKRLLNLIMMLVIGLVGSSYFWLPALLDSQLMRYETLFSFADHYPVLKQLITPYWGYGGSHPGPDDGMSFFLGAANLIVLIGGVGLVGGVWGKLDKLKRTVVIWTLVVFGISVLMMNHRSVWVWTRLPLLDYFQFPWRFLMMTTLVIPLMLILLKNLKFSRWVALLVIIVTIPTTVSYFRPEHFLGRSDDYYFNRYIPVPLAQPEYHQIQEEYLRLPKATEARPERNYLPLLLNNPEATVSYQYDGLSLSATVNSESATTLEFYKYHFPGWRAWVNNQETKIVGGKPFNQMVINLPEGQSTVRIRFGETGLKLFLDILSLVTLSTTLFFVLKRRLSYG